MVNNCTEKGFADNRQILRELRKIAKVSIIDFGVNAEIAGELDGSWFDLRFVRIPNAMWKSSTFWIEAENNSTKAAIAKSFCAAACDPKKLSAPTESRKKERPHEESRNRNSPQEAPERASSSVRESVRFHRREPVGNCPTAQSRTAQAVTPSFRIFDIFAGYPFFFFYFLF